MRCAASAIRHTWWAIVFGITAVATAPHASLRADESSAEAIVARIRSHLTRLSSYDITVTEAYEASPEFKRRQSDYKYHPPSRLVYRFRLEGNRFRRDEDLEGAGIRPEQSFEDKAFDGARYQLFHKKAKRLDVKKTPFGSKYGGSHALLEPFMFFFMGDLDFDKFLLDEDRWSTMAENADARGQATVDEERCTVVRARSRTRSLTVDQV